MLVIKSQKGDTFIHLGYKPPGLTAVADIWLDKHQNELDHWLVLLACQNLVNRGKDTPQAKTSARNEPWRYKEEVANKLLETCLCVQNQLRNIQQGGRLSYPSQRNTQVLACYLSFPSPSNNEAHDHFASSTRLQPLWTLRKEGQAKLPKAPVAVQGGFAGKFKVLVSM